MALLALFPIFFFLVTIGVIGAFITSEQHMAAARRSEDLKSQAHSPSGF